MSNRVCRRIVYAAAVLCHGCDDKAAWNCYLKWTQACWSGNVKSVIPELLAWLQSRRLNPAATLDEKHPDNAVHDGHRYLTNNASRMDYARYRRAGLPVTSAPMESLVKQVNLRVQGTEMFWNDANRGGESILQIKAAGLCDDSRLETYLRNRPGSTGKLQFLPSVQHQPRSSTDGQEHKQSDSERDKSLAFFCRLLRTDKLHSCFCTKRDFGTVIQGTQRFHCSIDVSWKFF